jgi:hypothetical protein
MGETRILIRLLWMYFPRCWEFGLALSKLRNFGRGGLTPKTPFGAPLSIITQNKAQTMRLKGELKTQQGGYREKNSSGSFCEV